MTASATAVIEYPPTRRALALGFWGKAAELGTLALLVTLVPRALGPSDYGAFALALTIVLLGSTALSISGAAVMSRFVAAAPVHERTALARALVLRALLWRSLGLAVTIVLAVTLVGVDGRRFHALSVALVVLAIALEAPATVAFQAALALGRVGAWSFRYTFQNLVLVAAALTLNRIAGVNGAIAAVPISSALALSVGLLLVARPLAVARATVVVPLRASRFARLQSWSNVFLVAQHRGPVVAAALLAASATETGYAGLATAIAMALTYVVWQLFTVTLPRFAASATVDPAHALLAVRRVTTLALAVVAPAAVIGVALRGPLLSAFVGSRFSGAETAFVPALAAVPLAPLTGAVASVAAIQLRPGRRLLTMVAGAAVFAVVAATLVPAYDATGATIALLAANGALALTGALTFRAHVGVRLLAASLAAVGAVLVVGVAT
jgi:O-antigen/teichoic acid export membrane protein